MPDAAAGAAAFDRWLAESGPFESVHAAVCDLNGIMRGKRIPLSQAQKALAGELRMPLSLLGVDVWGEDIAGSTRVFEEGDRDGLCGPTGRAPLPVTWTARPSALIPMWLFLDDGMPFLADPRQALAEIVRRYHACALHPVVAVELEFYLIDPAATETALPPVAPQGGARLDSAAVMSNQDLDDFGAFLSDVYATCERQGIATGTAVSENGAGQFEVCLMHGDDPLRAADDAVLLKTIVRGVACRHGLAATFMAKPYGMRAGSGMHVHMSLLDQDRRNIFDDGTAAGAPALSHAVAGMLRALPQTTLVFAPHLNSYRRLRPHMHAPTSVSWGYENRTAALRIPGGNPTARRIEHRVAGADANPYLVLAAILGAALLGIRNGWEAPPPSRGRPAMPAGPATLPADWGQAIGAFETGDIVPDVFHADLRAMFVACKRQEHARFAADITPLETASYLRVV